AKDGGQSPRPHGRLEISPRRQADESIEGIDSRGVVPPPGQAEAEVVPGGGVVGIGFGEGSEGLGGAGEGAEVVPAEPVVPAGAAVVAVRRVPCRRTRGIGPATPPTPPYQGGARGGRSTSGQTFVGGVRRGIRRPEAVDGPRGGGEVVGGGEDLERL